MECLANYTKLGKFVLLKRFMLKIGLLALIMTLRLARTSTAFSLVFKKRINAGLQCILRQIKTFNMRKELFKVGYQKPKISYSGS